MDLLEELNESTWKDEEEQRYREEIMILYVRLGDRYLLQDDAGVNSSGLLFALDWLGNDGKG